MLLSFAISFALFAHHAIMQHFAVMPQLSSIQLMAHCVCMCGVVGRSVSVSVYLCIYGRYLRCIHGYFKAAVPAFINSCIDGCID